MLRYVKKVPILPSSLAVFVRAVPLPEPITAYFSLTSSKETNCSGRDVKMQVGWFNIQWITYVLRMKQWRTHTRRQKAAVYWNALFTWQGAHRGKAEWEAHISMLSKAMSRILIFFGLFGSLFVCMIFPSINKIFQLILSSLLLSSPIKIWCLLAH